MNRAHDLMYVPFTGGWYTYEAKHTLGFQGVIIKNKCMRVCHQTSHYPEMSFKDRRWGQ